MVDEITDKSDLINNFIKKIILNKKIFILSTSLIILFLSGIFIFNHVKNNENKKISENYVRAGIYLSQNDKENSKKIYTDIVFKKNKLYSLLSLNNIIENRLIENNDEILNLFTVIEKIKLNKDQKNLVKLKKALFFMKISKPKKAMKLFEEIISENSIWKPIALKISELK